MEKADREREREKERERERERERRASCFLISCSFSMLGPCKLKELAPRRPHCISGWWRSGQQECTLSSLSQKRVPQHVVRFALFFFFSLSSHVLVLSRYDPTIENSYRMKTTIDGNEVQFNLL